MCSVLLHTIRMDLTSPHLCLMLAVVIGEKEGTAPSRTKTQLERTKKREQQPTHESIVCCLPTFAAGPYPHTPASCGNKWGVQSLRTPRKWRVGCCSIGFEKALTMRSSTVTPPPPPPTMLASPPRVVERGLSADQGGAGVAGTPLGGASHSPPSTGPVSPGDRIPSPTTGAEPPRDAKDSGSARSHSTHQETSSSNRP